MGTLARAAILGAMLWGALPATASAQQAWTIPSNEAIEKLLAERMAHNGVGTVIGVIEPSGKRVVAYGRSDAPNKRPLDGDTVFQIGSNSKAFVGLLLADMVRRGEAAFDDPAQKYVPPGVKMPLRGRPITLLDLATQRSGLPSMPDNFRLDADPNPVEAYSVDDMWQYVSNFQLTREPGEKYEYSNLAFSLLAHLLARRAGKDYETLLKERVFEPVGMGSTGIKVTPAMAARLTPGHSVYLQPLEVWEMKTLQASGSIRSTANDMLRFIGAYFGESRAPIADSMTLQLRTRAPNDASTSLGWGAKADDAHEIYSWEGGKSAYRSAVVFDTRTHMGVVVLQNARTEDRPTAIAMYLLTGRPLKPAPSAPAPKPVKQLSAKILDRYAGTYRAKDGVTRVVHKGNRLIVCYQPGDEGLEFAASGERDFFYVGGNDDITFELDGKGAVTGMRIYSDGKEAGTFEVAPRLSRDLGLPEAGARVNGSAR